MSFMILTIEKLEQRLPLVFRGHFLHQKIPLEATPRAHFYGTLPYSLQPSMQNIAASFNSQGALAW